MTEDQTPDSDQPPDEERELDDALTYNSGVKTQNFTNLDSIGHRDDSSPSEEGRNIDHFTLTKFIAKGGFGAVYEAKDNKLERTVAIKLPHAELVSDTQIVQSYLKEAKTTALLDHRHVLPIHAIGSTQEVPFYMVTKLVRDGHLGAWVSREQPSFKKIVRLLASIAEALHYAHAAGVVHRDIKPGNILVDHGDHPYVTDFGLALRDADLQSGPAYVGTPSYMSPEQANGEGHRVNGQSDLFSLGSVMYLLLTGQRPFKAKGRREMYDRIRMHDPPWPHELNPQVPPDLSRVCMKALAKRTSQRFQTGKEFHDELLSASLDASLSLSLSAGRSELSSFGGQPMAQAIDSSPVVPKGLRAFDVRDADFYLQLLPGPYDHRHYPEVIRFWLSKTALGTADDTPAVGLINGISGCGKTSLVRAGIMPRIRKDVHTIYISATRDRTESDLLARVTALLPNWQSHASSATDSPVEEPTIAAADASPHDAIAWDTDGEASPHPQVHKNVSRSHQLTDAFAQLRRQRQQRVVIFIDQFEQWLFANGEDYAGDLVSALRQCDGRYVQCVLLVRDDFWGKVTRFFNAIDIPLLLGDNWTLLDLFDLAHARNVLRRFGVAYGKFPANPDLMTPQQDLFLDQAIQLLAVEKHVICVQLALFAEALKGQPWDQSLETANQEGGEFELDFFRQTFDAEQTPRRMRIHAEGASRVLQILLPDAGEVIKDVLRTEQELFEASGYQDRRQFRELLDILDHELHLITPSEQADELSLGTLSEEPSKSESGYQLTHDFLIKPLQSWMQFRSLASPEGKARLRLNEFTKLYRSVPRPQSLPTLLDYLSILYRTRGYPRTVNQQTMMLAAGRHHQRKAGIWLFATVVLIAIMLGTRTWFKHEGQVATNRATMIALLGAELPEAISLARIERDNVDIFTQCEQMLRDSQVSLENRVRASLVCLPNQPALAASTLVDYALVAPAQQVVQLAQLPELPYEQVRDRLWNEWHRPDLSRERCVRVACLLANDPKSVARLQDKDHSRRMVQCLLKEDPAWAVFWADGFYSIRTSLLQELHQGFASPDRALDELGSVHLISRFHRDEPERLISVIPYARPRELSILHEAIRRSGPEARQIVLQAIRQQVTASASTINVNEPWGSLWWCIGDRQPIRLDRVATEPLVKEIPSQWSATVAEHCCLIHKVPISQLGKCISLIERYGFSVSEISIENTKSSATAYLLALKDGTPRRWAVDLTAATLRTENQKHRDEGYIPSSVLAYGDRFTAVWFKPPADSAVLDGDIYVEIHEDRHEVEGWRKLLNQGIGLPRSNNVMRRSDGAQYFTSVRWKTDRFIGYEDIWDSEDHPRDIESTMQKSLNTPLQNRILGDGSDDDEQAKRTAIWWKSLPIKYSESSYLSLIAHQEFALQQSRLGFYPVSIHSKVFKGELAPRYESIWWAPSDDFEQSVEQGKRLANLNMMRYMLGDRAGVVESFAKVASPLEATGNVELQAAEQAALIAAFSESGQPIDWLVETVCDEQADVCIRQHCAKALALYPIQSIDPLALGAALTSVQATYQSTRDASLRSVLECLAKRWNWELPDLDITSENELRSAARDRLLVIRKPAQTWIGSSIDEPGRDGVKETPAQVKLDHSYAIATHEVTLEQFKQFRPEHHYGMDYTPDEQCPVVGVTLYDAMKYCRWLSEQEGLPEEEMCYPEADEIQNNMRLERDFADRKGYRLPTGVEWEYACRGGWPNNRWFGFDPSRLDEYAWTARNSAYRLHPVGQLLPNDYGLFDMLGNAMEWCHASAAPYADHPFVQADLGREFLSITNPISMQTRGGAMLYQPLDARASQVNSHQPDSQRVYISFRICKTVSD